MKKEDTVRLDNHFLVRRLEALGIKQWWLARQLEVDRKTVSRWVSGRVKRIDRRNAERLCAELGCTWEDLTARDETDVLATREEQRLAADAVREKDLLSLLSPTDNWALAETLIKATMQPNLPLRSLGQLYNLLSVTAWRQGEYEEGLEQAARAHEIGTRIRDRGIILKASLNQATIHSIVGPIGQAIGEFQACLARPERFESPRDHGLALSNLACCHREAGEFDAALAAQERSIEVFAGLSLDYNLAISWTSMGVFYTELGSFGEALAALDRARDRAYAANYERGLTCCCFYFADVYGLQGELSKGRALIDEALPRLETYPVFDLACLEILARHSRLDGRVEEAENQIADGLVRAAPFPIIRAMMLLERGRVALARDQPGEEERFRREANEIFRENGLSRRLLDHPVLEYGAPRRLSA